MVAYPSPATAAMLSVVPTASSSPADVLCSLVEGNRRFAEGRPRHGYVHSPAARSADQQPYALVIGCLDSRVIPEALFDQDFGSIMVVRVGGHVIDSGVLGSVDFAVAALNVPLLLILGHQYCGAVITSVAAVCGGVRPDGPVRYLVDQIEPAIDEVLAESGPDTPDLVDRVVYRHLTRTVEQISAVPLVARRVEAGALRVVGAHYEVDTARVDLLDM